MAEDYKKKILEILEDSPVGLTISEISRILNISRPTVYRYIGELKAEGKIREFSVGAYKIYTPREKFETTRRLISRKFLCSLVGAFSRLFKERSTELAFELGRNLVDAFLEIYPKEKERVASLGMDPFEKLRLVLYMLLEREVSFSIIRLDNHRAVIHIYGNLCPVEVTRTLQYFVMGAIKKFLEIETSKQVSFGSTMTRGNDENQEIIIEVTLRA